MGRTGHYANRAEDAMVAGPALAIWAGSSLRRGAQWEHARALGARILRSHHGPPARKETPGAGGPRLAFGAGGR